MSNMRKVMIGCGGLFVLGVLFVGCAAILTGTGDSGGDGEQASEQQSSQDSQQEAAPDDAASEEEAPQQEAPQQEEVPESRSVGLGDPVNVGEVAWIVSNAVQAQELQSQFGEFGENQQGNFVIVDFTFTNNSSEAVTLDTVSMTLVDGQGRSFEADPGAFEYIDPNRMIFLEQVNPGVSREGTAIFTVAPDAADFDLELGDAALFSGETAYVELGF